jgi:hypothetical protein
MSISTFDGHRSGRRTAHEIAQAVLAFIMLDRRRLDRFLDEADVDAPELKLGMTRWLALRVLQHVIDSEDLRDLCVAAGLFRGPFEREASGPAATGYSFRGVGAAPTLPVYH